MGEALCLELAPDLTIWHGDVREALRQIPDESVQCCVTSPPYLGLRDYGTAQWEGGDPNCDHSPSNTPKRRGVGTSTLGGGKATVGHQREGYREVCPRCGARRVDQQIGLEPTVEEYVAVMVEVFREVRRVLRPDGTLWLNIGDKYNGSGGAGGDYGPGGLKEGQPKYPGLRLDEFKPKDLLMIPARVAMALQADGWYLRAAVPWLKGNAMPESVTDRPSTAHEWMFLLTKSERYYYDADAIREPAVTTRPEALSWARSGKHSQLLVPGANNPQHRPDREKKRVAVMYPADMVPDPTKGRPSGVAGINPAGRNRRTTDWWNESLDLLIDQYDSYLANLRHIREHGGLLLDPEGEPLAFMVNPRPFPEAHFAVYPPDLIEPCILAGTSPRACPKCGAPWRRVVEKTGFVAKREPAHVPGNCPTKVDSTGWKPATVATTEFIPACSCEGNDGSGKCLVLDPFLGSGTTAAVALEHGRAAIGCELNADYIEIAKRRLCKTQTTLLGML